jgi:predicted HTH transcriptional regulator
MRGADFSELRRRDVWSIPLTILREAVINAVVHADYSQKGAPIRISFFDDRIEIENPGILLPGLTVEDMLQGVSKLRNRVIARVFRELDLIEQWGSGVSRMFKEAEALGLPEPEVVEVGMRVRFIVHLAESIAVETTGLVTGEGELRPELQPELRLESRLESRLAAKVFILLMKNDSGKAELASGLGHKTVSGELHKQIRRLLELDYIEMTNPEKPQSSKQKYRLTAKGKDFLAKEAHEGIE